MSQTAGRWRYSAAAGCGHPDDDDDDDGTGDAGEVREPGPYRLDGGWYGRGAAYYAVNTVHIGTRAAGEGITTAPVLAPLSLIPTPSSRPLSSVLSCSLVIYLLLINIRPLPSLPTPPFLFSPLPSRAALPAEIPLF